MFHVHLLLHLADFTMSDNEQAPNNETNEDASEKQRTNDIASQQQQTTNRQHAIGTHVAVLRLFPPGRQENMSEKRTPRGVLKGREATKKIK